MAQVCVLAKEGSVYANMVLSELANSQIDFDVVWIKKKKKKNRISNILLIPFNLYKSVSTGRFKSLSKLNWWTWSLFFKMRKQKVSSQLAQKVRKYTSKKFDGVYMPGVNHVQTYSYLNTNSYDIGILAGVDIVHELILNEFKTVCLNAHPAPLPECRGGGALENTLLQNLQPSSSVHRVTGGIDEGEIYKVKEITLEKNDNFKSIYLKLNVLGASLLASVTKNILAGDPLDVTENKGKLNYWKDLTIDKQKKAHDNLTKMLKQKEVV